jgi:hypothetical protein
VPLGEFRLLIEEIHLRRRAFLEEEDDVLGFGFVVRGLGGKGVCYGCGRHQVGQGKSADASQRAAQKISAQVSLN